MATSNGGFLQADSSTPPPSLPPWLSNSNGNSLLRPPSPSVTLTLSSPTVPAYSPIPWLQQPERIPDNIPHMLGNLAPQMTMPSCGGSLFASELVECCRELDEGHRAWAAHKKETTWRLRRQELQLEAEKGSRIRQKMEEVEGKVKTLREEEKIALERIEAEYKEQLAGLRKDAEAKEQKLAEQWAAKHLSLTKFLEHMGCRTRIGESSGRFARRAGFEGEHIVDLEQGEFLCPVCRRLANATLPAFPREYQKIWNPSMSSTGSLSHVSGHLNKPSEKVNPLYIQQAVGLLQSAAKAVGKNKVHKDISVRRHRKVNRDLEAMSIVLSKLYFGKQDKLISSSKVNPSILMWDTLKYSLISMEIAARSNTNMNPNIGLNSLYNELKSSGGYGFILPLLLKVIQSDKCEDSLLLLQRFCGIQRFADSICSGISKENASDSCGQGILHILTSLLVEFPQFDIQFLSRGSDPVLAHDPFASLMWVLFCLPFPFLSCKESLLSLVHIFYLVSVAQAIITSCIKHQGKVDGLGPSDCLVADICKIMRESEYARQYFVSNYTEPSLNIKEMICSLTFPYLRRCALLLKLLNSSARVPIFYGETALETYLAGDDMIDNITLELKNIEKLEKMFEIPALDVVLKDGASRSLVWKWFFHLNKEFELQRPKNIKHFTPAISFQLIRLPHVYHDLLQRYIKKRCPDCKRVIDDPALCLLCGRLCSGSFGTCCRESECQAHANICAAGTGVFLLIWKTKILLQRAARLAPWPSPYLDAFGEDDVDMHRGKPLFLNEERYAALSYMMKKTNSLCFSRNSDFFLSSF